MNRASINLVATFFCILKKIAKWFQNKRNCSRKSELLLQRLVIHATTRHIFIPQFPLQLVLHNDITFQLNLINLDPFSELKHFFDCWWLITIECRYRKWEDRSGNAMEFEKLYWECDCEGRDALKYKIFLPSSLAWFIGTNFVQFCKIDLFILMPHHRHGCDLFMRPHFCCRALGTLRWKFLSRKSLNKQ